MWKSNDNHTPKENKEETEIQTENRSKESSWNTREDRNNLNMSSTERERCLATGDDNSTKAMSLKRKTFESDYADTNTKTGKLSKTLD